MPSVKVNPQVIYRMAGNIGENYIWLFALKMCLTVSNFDDFLQLRKTYFKIKSMLLMLFLIMRAHLKQILSDLEDHGRLLKGCY